jgi:NAD(P)-dependent dehydrogenase (short-subunit alcohol dehydrogenase family)
MASPTMQSEPDPRRAPTPTGPPADPGAQATGGPAGLPGLPEPPPSGATALPAGTFAGETVLVTGGGTGLGRAIAAEFARLGAALVIASRKDEHRAAGERAMAELGAPVTSVACDIRDAGQIAAAFDAAETAFGLPGVLVNNAAANFPVPAEDMSPNAWRTVVDITLNGTFLCAREFARRHLAAGTPGAIVNVGASYAWTGGPGFAHSAAAKAGVKNMVETLAVEWAPYGIQVNGLVPGLFPHEDMTADIRGNLDRTNDKDACQPALRVGRLRELGWAATFLASPYARFVTGHTLVVDGANWQRRTLTNPPVVTVRDQMGRGPFAPDGP